MAKKSDGPFHVVHLKHEGKHAGYDVYVNNVPFLTRSADWPPHKDLRLTRPEAYAIVKLLNKERRGYKWADKFVDPY